MNVQTDPLSCGTDVPEVLSRCISFDQAGVSWRRKFVQAVLLLLLLILQSSLQYFNIPKASDSCQGVSTPTKEHVNERNEAVRGHSFRSYKKNVVGSMQNPGPRQSNRQGYLLDIHAKAIWCPHPSSVVSIYIT